MCSSISTSVRVASVVATLVMRCGEAGGGRLVAGLAEVDRVAFPAGARAWSRIERRCHRPSRSVLRWAGDRCPPAMPPPPLPSVIVLWYCVIHALPRDGDRGNLAQPRWCVAGMGSLEQVKSVSAHLHGQLDALVLALGKPIRVGSGAIPLHPFGHQGEWPASPELLATAPPKLLAAFL
jgi:hypothetical protein